MIAIFEAIAGCLKDDGVGVFVDDACNTEEQNKVYLNISRNDAYAALILEGTILRLSMLMATRDSESLKNIIFQMSDPNFKLGTVSKAIAHWVRHNGYRSVIFSYGYCEY